MKLNLKKVFDSRVFNMCLSVFIAIIAWMMVNPEGEAVIEDVPVNFEYDSASYTAKGLDIVSSPVATVDIRVRGKRSYVNSLGAEDFLIYPNYTQVHGAGEYNLGLQIKVQDNNWDSSGALIVNDRSIGTVDVVFDTVITKTFEVETDTSNVQIAQGYIFDKAQCSPSEITLKGPEGEISKVDRIVAPLYVEGERSDSVTQSATLVPVDENGGRVELEYVSFSSEIAEVTLLIQQRKELPLNVEFTNVPSGFDVNTLKNRLTLSDTSLVVSGDSRKLDTLSSLTVAYFDVTTFALDKIYTMPITLPTGIKNQENVTTIDLSFDSTDLAERTISVSDIRTANIPDGYDVSVHTKKVTNVTLIGPEDELEALSASSVVAQLNGEDLQLSAGVMNAPVRILVPGSSSIFAVGNYTIECEVSNKSEG